MKGLVTKKDFFLVLKEMGVIIALRLLFSGQRTALKILW
jgi:hypothetical protein